MIEPQLASDVHPDSSPRGPIEISDVAVSDDYFTMIEEVAPRRRPLSKTDDR
jgi:hypothetical protein